MSRGKSSPIHQAEARDRLLDRLREGAVLDVAAESIGTSGKTAKRFADVNPWWAERVEMARRGERTTPEVEPYQVADHTPAPFAPSAVVDGVPVPCTPGASVSINPPAQGPARPDMLLGVSIEEIDQTFAAVFRDTEHKHWPVAAKMFGAFAYGSALIRARREAERVGSDDSERRVVFVFVSKSSHAP